MLKLPSVELFAIDTVKPELTLEAIEFSCRWVEFAGITVLTDLNKHPQMKGRILRWGDVRRTINWVHHEESDVKIQPIRKAHYPLPLFYEIASMREPIRHMRTDHIVFLEWDAAVLNPLAWRDEWLQFDYIGAPWPPFLEDGWPQCDGHTNNVGNAGFSLRSRKYCEYTNHMMNTFPDLGNFVSCDMTPCLTHRKWLKDRGVKFAPDDVAMAFSCENRIYNGSFGFHGTWTVERNGWRGDFWERRYPKK